MVSRELIEAYAAEVARQFEPEKIILFGSYAYGTPTEDSDVDLLVIMPFRGRAVRKAIQIRQQIDAPFPMDLLVRTPATIAQRLKWGDFFLQEATTQGQVLYESTHDGEVALGAVPPYVTDNPLKDRLPSARSHTPSARLHYQ